MSNPRTAVVTGASRGAGHGSRCGPPFDLSFAESPAYLGKAVVALAEDAEILTRSGQLLHVGDLAKVYGFADVEGKPPPVFRSGDVERAQGEPSPGTTESLPR
jgi:hypothetical protein